MSNGKNSTMTEPATDHLLNYTIRSMYNQFVLLSTTHICTLSSAHAILAHTYKHYTN